MENKSLSLVSANENENLPEIFKSEQFGEIRVVVRDGEPWFVAADVCKALDIGNPTDVLNKRVDADEKSTTLFSIEGGYGAVSNREINIVNEAGLYSLMFGSRKPEAKDFKRWITHDVIPSIRKTGGYVLDYQKFVESNFPDISDAAKMVMATALEENYKSRERIKEMEPKYTYCKNVLNCTDAMTTTQIAKEYGMSAVAFNKLLQDYKIQFKQRGQWLLYSPYDDRGYTDTYTYLVNDDHTSVRTVWTQAGREFLYRFLKKKGIVPTCEAVPAV